MVPEEQVRQVPVQVCRMVAEEKVEPVTTQVMKMVTEQRTVQVARSVAKQVPYTTTVRMPRTVVTRVPLDACGNPLPSAASPPTAAAARPTVMPAAVSHSSGAQALAPSLAHPMPEPSPALPKTYEDAAVAPAATAADEWTASDKPHVAPSSPADRAGANGRSSDAASGFRADRPAVEPPSAEAAVPAGTVGEAAVDPPLRSIDSLDLPTRSLPGSGGSAEGGAAAAESNLPQPGPAVEPAGPAVEPRVEGSSAARSGRPLFPAPNDRTT